jgi:hypothetical protein
MSCFRQWAVVCLLVIASSTNASNCSSTILGHGRVPTYGWEAEYVLGENPGLWNLYHPAEIPESTWRDMDLTARDQWTRDNVNRIVASTRTALPLVRSSSSPNFLPENLIMDETRNWEIVGGVSRDYASLESQITQVENIVGPGSYQAHVVLPFDTLEKGAAGYSLFSADLITLRKFSTQLKRFTSDSAQIPGAFFLHPYLSVFTKLKKEMLIAVVDANLQGRPWQSVLPQFQLRYPALADVWREDRPFYKYTLANALRTDIYGNTESQLLRWGYEVRSAHKSKDSLLREVQSIRQLMMRGFSRFEPFVDVDALDPDVFNTAFSAPVRHLLQTVIPEGEPEAPRPTYFTFIHRPFEQYATRLGLAPHEVTRLRRDILRARTKAIADLEVLAGKFTAGGVEAKAAKNQALIVLAKFSDEMGLLGPMEVYLEQVLSGETGEAPIYLGSSM